MIDHFSMLGFRTQRLDNSPVANFYAEYGQGDTLMIFAGHTDVVPVGDYGLWKTDPFLLSEVQDYLYGRGVADMKGSLASMMMAAKHWVNTHPISKGRLGFLITSGEEGDQYHFGTPYVMEKLQAQDIHPNYCIVGEPSSTECLGDMIKIGRRGSLNGKLRLQGKQGHVAYPHLAINPIHNIAPALAELSTIIWDEGNEHFPPTSFQITHVHAGGQASNIIPQDIEVHFNFRYSTEQTSEQLQTRILKCFENYDLKPEFEWALSGKPFLTKTGRLLTACKNAILSHTQQVPECSTSGGTSDGRFIAPYGVEVIELGPVNQTIHQVNECVSWTDLMTLADIYYAIMVEILA